jgi:hypothetical protein
MTTHLRCKWMILLGCAAVSAVGLGRVKTKSNLVVALSGGGIFAFFALSVTTSLKIPGAVIPRRVFTRPGAVANPRLLELSSQIAACAFVTRSSLLRPNRSRPDVEASICCTTAIALRTTKNALPQDRRACDRIQPAIVSRGPLIFGKQPHTKYFFGCASMCPKTRGNWLRLPIVRFHPGSSCPQQPP